MKFYQCAHCGNQIIMLKDSGVPVVCCGEPMKQLIPGETDASLEKHVPDAVQKEQVVQVQVGRIAHPHDAGAPDRMDRAGDKLWISGPFSETRRTARRIF